LARGVRPAADALVIVGPVFVKHIGANVHLWRFDILVPSGDFHDP